MTNRPDKMDVLKQIPVFRYLSRRHLEMVARNTDEIDVPAGRVLTEEGRVGHELYVIATGAAEVTRQGRHLATFGPGDFVGELSLLDQEPGSATVTTTEPCVLLVIGERQFHSLLLKLPALTLEVLRGVAQRLRNADEKLSN